MQAGKVVFLTGVSGAGKTTMMDLLLSNPQFEKVCSVTTRAPRAWEVNGDQYVFVSTQEFEQLIAEGKLLEYAFVHQTSYYGTRLDWLQESISHGTSPIKNIDPIGMEIIEKEGKLDGQYVCIFMDVPDKIMRERILHRQSDMPEEEIQKRLTSAQNERAIMQRLRVCHVLDATGTVEEVYDQIKQILEL